MYKAKRNAEVATGVGKETDIMVLSKAGSKRIGSEQVTALSEVYDSELSFGKTNPKLFEILKTIEPSRDEKK